jgi:YHS domain-containing protein
MGWFDGFKKNTASGDKVKDPVCGMTVNLKTTKFTSEYKGKTYGFCSENCKKQFDAEPDMFLS